MYNSETDVAQRLQTLLMQLFPQCSIEIKGITVHAKPQQMTVLGAFQPLPYNTQLEYQILFSMRANYYDDAEYPSRDFYDMCVADMMGKVWVQSQVRAIGRGYDIYDCVLFGDDLEAIESHLKQEVFRYQDRMANEAIEAAIAEAE